MIIDLGTRAISVRADEPTGAFTPKATRTVLLRATKSSSVARRAVVELRRFHGGMAPRALLGARFEPGSGELALRVSEGAAAEGRATCRVQLGGRKLIPGLPREFVESAIGGLSRTVDLGSGEILVDRAGVDPVETSPLIMELAAELLGRVLSQDESDDSLGEQLRTWLEALP